MAGMVVNTGVPYSPYPTRLGPTQRTPTRRAADLSNDRTQQDIGLDRERMDLEKQRAALEQTRADRQASANDQLLALARGGSSSAPTPAPTGSGVPGSVPGAGGGSPNPTALGILSTTPLLGAGGSNSPQQTQVQDRAAQRTTGAMANLERSMIDRGTLGSGLHAGAQRDLLAAAGDDLLDADVEFANMGMRRGAEIEDRNYAGGQRTLEREAQQAFQRKQSLLDLLAGVRY